MKTTLISVLLLISLTVVLAFRGGSTRAHEKRQVTSKVFTVYEHRDYKGASIQLNTYSEGGVEKCRNMPPYFNNLVSSINTNGNCIMGFPYADCEGLAVVFRPTTSYHNDLQSLSFNDEMSSYQACFF